MPLQPALFGIASLMAALLLSHPASAVAPTCPDFPVSALRLFSMHPSIDEVSVTRAEMNRLAVKIGVSATERALHPLMLMTANIDAHVTVQNRAIQVTGGIAPAYCDAPTMVAIAFGVVGRNAFLLREATDDPCVRHALLDHYAEHSRALDKQVELFIREQRRNVGLRLEKLKQTAAPDPTSANKEFEVRLWPVLKDMIQQFKDQMRGSGQKSRNEIDSVEKLDQLRSACRGEIRDMEQSLTAPERTTVWVPLRMLLHRVRSQLSKKPTWQIVGGGRELVVAGDGWRDPEHRDQFTATTRG